MRKNKTKLHPPATIQNFPIVGIGASAGGLDAFKSLLQAIPENSGMAYVLVQHLDPAHGSILTEILQRITKIPVLEITNQIHLAPDHIYVIPPNKMFTSVDGVLKITKPAKKINLSIDVFFTSLAEVHREFAVGVVLSGTGTDGTLGLKAIKEQGGICIAQDAESLTYDGMPQSAINSGVVDFILPPEKIPEQLLLINNTFQNTHFFKDEEVLPKSDEAVFKQILSLLRQRSGVDFTYYKQPTIYRRIARRITITKKKNLTDYLKLLRSEKAEQDELFQDILIPVTSFFHDQKTFQFLSTTVFPSLFKNKSKDEPVRIWVAGCSTGEEAYSIAISLHEYLVLSKNEAIKIQLFASDISEKAIKKARSGIYDRSVVEKLSQERINTYFIKKKVIYEVSKHIRDMCIFTTHNFLEDPPFTKMDLISCRNVLIYMNSFLQKKVLTTFHYALKENGFLLLGKSESTSNVSELFSSADNIEKIYSRKQLPGRYMPIASKQEEEALVIKSQKLNKKEPTQTDFRKSAEATLLSKYTPASVVVNEQMDIVHIHGTITPFLVAPLGKPTFNLIKMACEGLAFELRNALHKAKTREATVLKENIPIKFNGTQYLVNIEIVPLDDTVDLHYLILFTKTAVPVYIDSAKFTNSRKIAETLFKNEQLEKELVNIRKDMNSVTEDMEATNDELQSANEELTILNQELMDKQEQLNAARLYSEAIISTIREPLVVLDKSLRIKTANSSFYKKFNTTEEETEDKLFYEIQNQQWDDSVMRSLLENILPKNETIVDLEISMKFPILGERYLLMNAKQIKNEKTAEHLILLAIEDISEQIAAQKIVEISKKNIEKESKFLHDFFTEAPAILAILKGPEHVFEFANPAYIEHIGGRNPTGKKLIEAVPEIKGQGFTELLDNVYNTGKTFIGKEMPIMIDKGKGNLQRIYLNFTYQVFTIDEDKTKSILVFAYDSTEQVEARIKLEVNALLIHNIYMNAPASICTFKGPTHIYELVNPAYQKLFENRDLVGKPFLKALPELKSQGVDKILDNVYKTGEIFTSTEILITLAGADNKEPKQRYFNTTMQPIYNEVNKIIGVVNFGFDVTEQIRARKQIEKSVEEQKKLALHLQLATNSAKVGIWTLDIASSKLEWSSIHKAMWGYDENYGNLTYVDWHNAILTDDKELVFNRINQSKINHTVYDVEYRIKRVNDGAINWIKSSGHYHYDEFGVAHTLSGISINISSQKLYDAELLEAKTKAEIDKEVAEHAVMSKQQFLSNMSHEIRTPMNSIIGFTKVLLKTELSDKQKEYLQAIKSSGNALIVLINDILDLAKVDSGKLIFANMPFNLLHSINTILHLFETKIEESNLKVVMEFDSSIPHILLGDAARLHQILINLLSNAIKFTPKGKIILGVNLISEDNDKVTLEIKVTDTGIGISQNQITSIFENFEQASVDTSRLYGGTGLGLAIVKQLVEKQGGSISVISTLGVGSAFSFMLSFEKTNAVINVEAEEEENKSKFNSLKVLVVEDVKLNQLLLSTILDDFNFEWDIADDGKIAIEKLQSQIYDIILMDLQMPLMNGFEATEYIRNTMNLLTPIIALTADVTTVDLDKCKAIGMNDYISKPFDEKLLHKKIMDLIKSK